MKSASLAEIKKELSYLSHLQLLEICLRLSKFKKVNKDLINYLLFEAHDEAEYIKKVKEIIELRFEEMPFSSLFFTTKYIRKTLRIVKLYIQFSSNKQTEIELMLFFCAQLKISVQQWRKYVAIANLYERQLDKISKDLSKLHEDLQYDYTKELEKLILT